MNIIKRILRVIVRTAIYLYCKVVYRLKVIGKENIPKEGPVIYCGNHRSYSNRRKTCKVYGKRRIN